MRFGVIVYSMEITGEDRSFEQSGTFKSLSR
jgi:hypothetical protein